MLLLEARQEATAAQATAEEARGEAAERSTTAEAAVSALATAEEGLVRARDRERAARQAAADAEQRWQQSARCAQTPYHCLVAPREIFFCGHWLWLPTHNTTLMVSCMTDPSCAALQRSAGPAGPSIQCGVPGSSRRGSVGDSGDRGRGFAAGNHSGAAAGRRGGAHVARTRGGRHRRGAGR